MPEKTEMIYANGVGSILTSQDNANIIGYRVGSDSELQRIRYTGTGCVQPGIVVFHFGTRREDIFMFENDCIAYMLVSMKSEDELYLTEIYNRAVMEKWSEERFIEEVVIATACSSFI